MGAAAKTGGLHPAFLYVPNLIGYARVILNITCFFTFATNYILTFWLYLTSFILDFFDGYFARKFNQCSTLGVVLDMVTDRTATAGFLMCLSHFYPAWVPLWGSLMTLDILSHWMEMYSAVAKGRHHKDQDESSFFLLRLYYNGPYKIFFAYCCIGAEVFYIALYMCANGTGPIMFTIGHEIGFYEMWVYICFPGWAFKQVVNVVQLFGAAEILAEMKTD